MIDNGLRLLLVTLLGIGGIAIITLAWVQPMPTLERVTTTAVGLIGPGWALTRIPSLISKSSRN